VVEEIEAVLFFVIVRKKILAASISVISTSIFVCVVPNGGYQRGAVRGVTYGFAETGIMIAVIMVY
jgi:hypothetical protein